MVCALVPEAFSQIDTTDAVAVTTNVGAARPQEFIDGFLRNIAARYKAYVFDLCLLWGVYGTEPEWRAHLAHVSEVWGREPQLLFAAGDHERYYIAQFDG